MARIWKEKLNSKRHRDLMSTMEIGGIPLQSSRDNLIAPWVYFVEVASFTFQFHSHAQIKECLEYFSKKTHPSSNDGYGRRHEHYWQRWYERLPKGLNKEPRRKKIVQALERAIELFKERSDI